MHPPLSFGPTRSRRATVVALTGAALLTFLLLGQLYSFESFATVLSAVAPTTDSRAHSALAAIIIGVELLSVPYLLGAYMSPLFRVFSALSGVATSLFWFMITFTNAHAQNSGLLSESIVIPGGVAAAAVSLLLGYCIFSTIWTDTRFRHAGS